MYTFKSKKDFSFLEGGLFSGLWVLILMGFLRVFFPFGIHVDCRGVQVACMACPVLAFHLRLPQIAQLCTVLHPVRRCTMVKVHQRSTSNFTQAVLSPVSELSGFSLRSFNASARTMCATC